MAKILMYEALGAIKLDGRLGRPPVMLTIASPYRYVRKERRPKPYDSMGFGAVNVTKP